VTHATAETTREMFKLGGVMKLQRALKVPVSGVLDMQTQQALRMHQREHDIVETGLPDFESVKSLGIEPEEMFHHFVPAERGAP